jgi:hypothetical protein
VRKKNDLDKQLISNNQLNGNLAPLIPLTILKHPEKERLLTKINIEQE